MTIFRFRKLLTQLLPKTFKHYLREQVLRTPLPMWRVRSGATRILGTQYKPDHDCIEIDITYACNLNCPNCNRSVNLKPADQMTPYQIGHFIQESIEQNRKWKRIRLLGGEPTAHPQLLDILNAFLDYKRNHSPRTLIEITTNGHGKKVEKILATIPEGVVITNTEKSSGAQDYFVTFNVAPMDLEEYENVDYSNGCEITAENGIGLTKYGYYPCAVAGGIDRIFGLGLGRQSLPEKGEDMHNELDQLCRYCGHFKRGNHTVSDSHEISVTWRTEYAEFKQRQPALTTSTGKKREA
ncbi:MAG: radical SAM protein [Candidatus Sedimenticola sp. 20ELBAFRAG]